MSDNINVEVKKKNTSIPPKNLRELTKQVSEIEGTIDDINVSVEEAEQDVNEIKRAINNSDDFVIRDNKMKRKNKAYNPAQYSGLGEIYLEKNNTFLGREFDEFVVNVNVPDPTAIAETFDGLVYDRQKKEFLVYELVDGERVYYAEWIKFDKWESTDDYVPEAGYDFICEADDKAYRWTEETTPDLIETEAHYGNVLKQEMVNLSNTIYHIQYDYDMNGKEVVIPENCALQFEGGSLFNGEIVGQNTNIKTEAIGIFNTNVNFSGTWNVDVCNTNWFIDNNNNYSNNIRKALDISKTVHIPEGRYTLKDELTITTKAQITGDGYENVILYLEAPINILRTLGFKLEGIAFAKSENAGNLDCFVKVYRGFSNVITRCAFYGTGNPDVACGIILDAELNDKGYYTTISNCRITSLPIGVKCTNNSNANTIDTNEFNGCDICVLIDSCNGERVLNNTFQSFNTVGVRFEYNNYGSITRGNLVCGNYFEGVTATAIGDVDFTNNDNCNNNYILGNNFSPLNTQSPLYAQHTINMTRENLILESTRNTLNRTNFLPGFTKFDNLESSVLTTYLGDRFCGCIVPIVSTVEIGGEEKENIDFYVATKKEDAFRWVKLLTYEPNGHFRPDNIDANQIHFYHGGLLDLPYDTQLNSRALCYERWRDLLKYGLFDGSAWKYLQNIVACVSSDRPTGAGYLPEGYMIFDKSLGKPLWWVYNKWVTAENIIPGTLKAGTFAQKPNFSDNQIYVGFGYFCEDKQTVEGSTNGIMIYYKGQDTTDPNNPVDIWVDALGRTVS